MAAVQKGTVGAFWGVKTTSISVNGATHEVIRTYNYSKSAKDKEVLESDGDVALKTFYDPREQITVDIIITGTDQAAALADFILLPDMGDDATITDTSDTQIAATTWIVIAASKVAACDDYGTMSLTLEKYANVLATKS